VAHLVTLRSKVLDRGFDRRCNDRCAFHHLDAGILESRHFFRIVREKADLRYPEIMDNRSRQSVIPKVGFETELNIGFDSIHPFVLEFVSPELIDEADAPALLMLIDEQSALLLNDLIERQLELRTAVAAETVEYVAGQTLGVNTREGRPHCWREIADLESNRFFGTDGADAFKTKDPEFSKSAGEVCFGNFPECEIGLGQ